mmetsp:Transcript_41647/g.104624  ORF Transcript_41647/g.104624 Transcript_41647/m.104624 type:complete len:411 (+) Transcript_41647:106-1338(+)
MASQTLSCRANLAGPRPTARRCAGSARVAARASPSVRCEAGAKDQHMPTVSITKRALLSGAAALGAVGAIELPRMAPAFADVVAAEWEKINLPVPEGVVLLDIGFEEGDPNHGFILGTGQTLLETTDGGKSWSKRDIPQAEDEGINYRFQSISFAGKEGWIVGKPAILLHTNDGGVNWERIPLSAKLPGAPLNIYALPGEAGQAEMVTDQGAIYVTSNTGYNWTAGVEETVDATLNRTVSSGISGASYYEGFFSTVKRSATGEYVAVSSRGNFYMTWAPGQSYWFPHNRPTARRVQSMGWDPNNKIWLTNRGGGVFLANKEGLADTDDFDAQNLQSRGYGMLDIGFSTDPNVGFACGGSGSLFKTTDGGKTWKRVKGVDQIAGNLYEVKFFAGNRGFVLGNDGILLRYIV